MEDHGAILEAIKLLREDMRLGFEGLGKRMDKMEGDLGANIKDVATLTERVRGQAEALQEERERSKEAAEKSTKQVSDLYDKDREVLSKVGALEKRIYLITAALMVLVEGGKSAVLKLVGM